ncbi:aminotransferase class IV [Marinoscillum sp.]|uniref:aminotransferase class IV n=1 Tax=Marinoscillum sp. TaxID=2024838 RepID=UPI003BA91E3E
MKCLFNDQLKNLKEVSLPIQDIALLRGYGIFDFFRLSDGVPLFMEDHLDRFYRGAEKVRLEVPVDKQTLIGKLQVLFAENNMPVSGVRLILTGGTGNGAFAIGQPNLIVTQEPISFPTSEMFVKGVKLITHEYLRDLPDVKTINYMTGIWLQDEVQRQGAFDVLYHHQGLMHELTRSNIFIVDSSGKIITPAERVLHGVTRKYLIQTLGNVEQRAISMQELFEAREVFITGTTKKVLPIVQIDDHQVSEGPGPITQMIMNTFTNVEKSYVDSFKQQWV